MHFCQLDRITELKSGEKIEAVRSLALSESYLQDHFPRFPVMPGVLMLESIYQAGMWLVYATEDFQYSTVALKEANQVKFNDFLQPGNRLTVSVKWKKQVGDEVTLTATGEIQGKRALKAQIKLDRFNLCDRGLAPVENDLYIRSARKAEMLRLLNPLGQIRNEIMFGTAISSSEP